MATKTKNKPIEEVMMTDAELDKMLDIHVTIPAPKFRTVVLNLRGITPLVMHKFSEKAKKQIMAQHQEGRTSRTKTSKNRDARDFTEEFNQARHISTEGWDGIPAGAFREAAISACRIVGFKMTLAKLAIFVEADGKGIDGTPLVRIYGTPREFTAPVRLESGVISICARPMYEEWALKLRVRYDADMFKAIDVVNLFARVGLQVGIGEGRPNSKNSAGQGWGTFEIVEDDSSNGGNAKPTMHLTRTL